MKNIGILGAGKMGMIHADLIKGNKDLKLIALCKKRKDRLDELKEKYHVEVFTDIEKFLSLKEMEYVVISTTNETHEEMAVRSMEKGKNVIVEKPMSTSYESTQRMISASNKFKKKLLVFHNRRWDRDYLLIKDIIKSGKIGKVLLVQSKVLLCDEGWPYWGIHGREIPWRIKAEYGGGILPDWGSHLVDQILQLMGKDPVSIYGKLQKGVWSTEVEDYFFAVLDFGGDMICQIEVGNNSYIELPRWYIVGTKGTMAVKGRNIPLWDEVELKYQKDDRTREDQIIKLVDVTELNSGFYNDFVLFAAGKLKSFVSMNETSKVVRIIDLIKKSHIEKKLVKF